MKKFTFLFVLFFCAKIAFGQWQAVGTLESRCVDDIFECNGNLYFYSVDGVGVYKSSDNGVTWNKKIYHEVLGANASSGYVKSYHFGDTLVFCFGTSVFCSYDDGETWDFTNLPRYSYSFFYLGNRLYSVGNSSDKQYFSIDFGHTWVLDTTSAFTSKNLTSTFEFQDTTYFFDYVIPGYSLYKIINEDSICKLLDISSESFVVATSNSRITIYHHQFITVSFITSSNGGLTWQNHPFCPSVSFFPENIWYRGNTLNILGDDKVYSTSDVGQNWQTQSFELKNERVGHLLEWNGYQFFPTQNNSIFRNQVGSFVNWSNFGPNYPTPYATLFKKVGNTVFYNFNMSLVPVFKNLNVDSLKYIKIPPRNDNGVWLSDVNVDGALFAHTDKNPFCYKSMDTARTWVPVALPSNVDTNYVRVDLLTYDNDTLYRLISDNSLCQIFYSTNFGDSWSQMYNDYVGYSNEYAFNVSFFKLGNYLFWGSKTVTNHLYQCARFKIENNLVTTWDSIQPCWNAFIARTGNTLFRIDNTNWNTHYLYKSIDFGYSWEICGNNLPDLTGDCSLYGNDSVMYFEMYREIYASVDKGYSWFCVNDNLNNSDVQAFMQSGDSLFAYVGKDKLYSRNIYDINYNRVSGFVYNDDNNNNHYDNYEQKMQGIRIGNSNDLSSVTNNDGNYYLFSSNNFNNDTIKVINPTLYSIIVPEYYIVNESDTGFNFAINRTPGIADLRVDITATTQPRPGFNYYINIIVQNDGTVAKNASLDFEYDDRFTLINSTFTPTMAVNNVLSWSFPGFYPLQSMSIWLTFRLNQTVQIGETVNFRGTISPYIGDTTMENNTDSISDIVVGSFDPNEKTINRAMYLSPQQVLNKSEMIYTVRFQNTGTWYAENVSILDTLHHNLDLSTFRVISASHDYNFDFSGNGIVRFNFPNINLPDSNMNEAASHGFIKYAVRLNNSIPLNDSITNTAHIYFDFNEAIVTNTTLNIVKIDAAINESPDGFNLNVYPNPAKTVLNVRFEKSSSYNLTLFSIDGRMVMNEKSNSEHHVLNIASLDKGIYLLKVSDKNRSRIVKVVIQ